MTGFVHEDAPSKTFDGAASDVRVLHSAQDDMSESSAHASGSSRDALSRLQELRNVPSVARGLRIHRHAGR
jgi:hypothetical protein